MSRTIPRGFSFNTEDDLRLIRLCQKSGTRNQSRVVREALRVYEEKLDKEKGEEKSEQ